MIDMQTQSDLLKLIAKNIDKDLAAYAFGGTAMMFYGYKNVTKDIDLVFDSLEERKIFIKAIEKLGYKQSSPFAIYTQEKLRLEKPVMYTRGDERFDLFAKKIFFINLDESIKSKIFARHDYLHKDKVLILNVLSKECIILLKSVTEREKDFDDILTIIRLEKNIDWDLIVNLAISQAEHDNAWAVLDLEKTLQRLREHTLIRKELFDKLYGAIGKK